MGKCGGTYFKTSTAAPLQLIWVANIQYHSLVFLIQYAAKKVKRIYILRHWHFSIDSVPIYVSSCTTVHRLLRLANTYAAHCIADIFIMYFKWQPGKASESMWCVAMGCGAVRKQLSAENKICLLHWIRTQSPRFGCSQMTNNYLAIVFYNSTFRSE